MVDVFAQSSEGANETVYDTAFNIPDIIDIVAADGLTTAQYRHYEVIRVRSATAGACDISANPQIETPSLGNPVLEIHGTDDTRTVQFDDGDGLTLANGSVILGDKNVLLLRYIDGSWVQIAPELEAVANIDNTVFGSAWDGSTNAPTQDRVYDQFDYVDGQILDKADLVHTHTASEVTDFDTEVSNNTDVAANTSKLLGIETGAQVNTVASVNTKTGTVVINPDDLSDTTTTHKFTTAGDISKLSGIEAAADVTDATNVAAAGAVMEGDTSTASMQFVIDEDNMASDSATKVPTQQSVKAYVTANAGTPTLQAMGDLINTGTEKTTPADNDMVGLMDSAASNILKKLSWTNIKATLKTYFDTLYNNYAHPNHSGDVTSVADGATTIATAAVTLAKMANMATASLIYRKTAGDGVPEVNTLATLKTDLGLTGTNSGDQTLPVKAIGAELDTGTDDDKFATAKALKDSHNVPSVAPGTSGNVLMSNGTDWASTALSGGGDMVLAGVQSVTGLKTFDKDKIAMKGTSTGKTVISTANTSATDYTATLPAADGTILYTNGSAANLTSFPTLNQDTTGTAAKVTVGAGDGDTTMWVLLAKDQTGNQEPATDGAITFNGTTNALTATTFIGALTGNASTATTLATTRAIYGNNFDGSAALTQVIGSAYGGTGNGFTKFTGATTAEKTFTLPDANATLARTDAGQTFTGQQVFTSNMLLNGAGTGVHYTSYLNNGVSAYCGIEGSAGAQILGGTSPYSFIIGTEGDDPVEICTYTTPRIRIAAGGAITLNSSMNYAADNEATDTYVITLAPAITAYAAGMYIVFKAKTINTGAASLNVNGLGAVTIVKRLNTTLANGDILAGMMCMVVHDGTNFVLMNPVVN